MGYLAAMAPMKAMKGMKGAAMTATASYDAVAETTGLKRKDVKSVVEGIMGVAAEGMKKRPATAARKGVNPFTKEPCVFKAKPASKTVKVIAMKKIKEAVNGGGRSPCLSIM